MLTPIFLISEILLVAGWVRVTLHLYHLNVGMAGWRQVPMGSG